jgi:hypothetical protein
MTDLTKKDAYEAPALTKIGSFEALTQWASGGGYTDHAFGAGTPANDITFSDAPPAN